MLENIKADLFRYYPVDYSLSILLKGFRSQGFRYMFFRRLFIHNESKTFISLFYRIILRHYSYKYGFQIGGNIGKGFYIGHFGTIVVSSDAQIGENCNISPGVIIGQAFRGKLSGTPIIGNSVWMGSNAVIVGNIKIGSQVLIAPGAYVNFDVPDHSIVIGNPGKIISRQNPTEGYICNLI